jgi:hypothetical protein
MSQVARKVLPFSVPRALPKETRVKISAAIDAHLNAVDRLIEVLDCVDGDPDFEPSLGAGSCTGGFSGGANHGFDQTFWASGSRDDREAQMR